jgi:toxin-antitoxin system PIN domain toxin
VRLADANVLIYAVDKRAERHAAAKGWLDNALSGNTTVLMPWVSLLAFVRIITHPSIYPNPVPVGEAFDFVDAWLGQPHVIIPEPDGSHARRMRELLEVTGRGGNLINDAHLAALALQHRATVVTFDNDFSRFPGVKWESPQG